MTLDIVEVKFLKGEPKRFVGARKEAREAGYPDVPTYLRATDKVNRWCKLTPDDELETILQAEKVRVECLKAAGRRNL